MKMSKVPIYFSIARFPGSNCDFDARDSLNRDLKMKAEFVWHMETSLPKNTQVVVVPGGFSYGDYLRPGAIASTSPLMESIKEFADNGGIVIGICNGFQILIEIGLLKGTLLRNANLKFVCKTVNLKVENNQTPFTNLFQKEEVIRVPIAHADGNFEVKTSEESSIEKQAVFKYCNSDGNLTKSANPNGSFNNIAGIINEKGNILGMMPHPERACDDLIGSSHGKKVFQSIQNYFNS